MIVNLTSQEALEQLIEECRYIQQLNQDKNQKSNRLKLFDSHVLPYFKKDLIVYANEVKNNLRKCSLNDDYVKFLKEKYPLDAISDAFFIDAAEKFTNNQIEKLYSWLLH